MSRRHDLETTRDATNATVHVARGRYFDELTVGDLYRHRPGRTVTDADNVLFSTLTMNPQSLHLDAAFSRRRRNSAVR